MTDSSHRTSFETSFSRSRSHFEDAMSTNNTIRTHANQTDQNSPDPQDSTNPQPQTSDSDSDSDSDQTDLTRAMDNKMRNNGAALDGYIESGVGYSNEVAKMRRRDEKERLKKLRKEVKQNVEDQIKDNKEDRKQRDEVTTPTAEEGSHDSTEAKKSDSKGSGSSNMDKDRHNHKTVKEKESQLQKEEAREEEEEEAKEKRKKRGWLKER